MTASGDPVRGGAIPLGHPTSGAALFIVEVPGQSDDSPHALALLELGASAQSARELAGSSGWSSAGFVEGEAAGVVLAHAPTTTGINWRTLPIQ